MYSPSPKCACVAEITTFVGVFVGQDVSAIVKQQCSWNSYIPPHYHNCLHVWSLVAASRSTHWLYFLCYYSI